MRAVVLAGGTGGAKLAAGIVERVKQMRARVDVVVPLIPEAVDAYQQKITERLREALGAADDERIRAEIALFAAKADVAEELDRLRAHLGEVEEVIRKGGAVGKRLDFIAQELNREANTLASKAASPAISDCALELKLLIEQIHDHQDRSPLGTVPLLVMDMWEHAYYLQYRNQKEKWIVAFWEMINWADVARRLANAECVDLALEAEALSSDAAA